ncbi:MAG: hypothetical protein JWR19_1533 [Pedosphaera sp.]|nr:hypothetical protein [Pedosphaera sp.]
MSVVLFSKSGATRATRATAADAGMWLNRHDERYKSSKCEIGIFTAEVLPHWQWESRRRLRTAHGGSTTRTRTNGDRTDIMNDKVKRGILRIRPVGGRVLRLDKVSQGGFKDGQGKLRQFKNQFFVSFRTGHHGERDYTYMRSLPNGGVGPPGLGSKRTAKMQKRGLRLVKVSQSGLEAGQGNLR